MAEYTLNIALRTNEDWTDSLSFVTGEPATPLDLSGYAFEQHIRTSVASEWTVLTCSTGNGRLTISDPPSAGLLSFNVPASVMSSIRPGVYVHDITATVDGHTRVIASGRVTVIEGVTR